MASKADDAAITGRRSVDDLAESCGTACRMNIFDAGTPVLMADGSHKPIEEVELGEEVVATDPETGEQGPRKVIDLIRHGGAHTMVDVGFAGGSQVDATAHHPFWIASEGEWADALDLQAGDRVLTAGGATLTVESVAVSQPALTAYNFTVAGLHTYHVGRDDALVHNCAMQKRPGAIASAWGYTTKQVRTAIERVKQGASWRGDGSRRNPDIVVDDVTGEVYPQLGDGTSAEDSIGNLFDYLPERD